MVAESQRRRILLTGATGFVGGRFLRLTRERYDLVAAARRPPTEALGARWLELDLDREPSALDLPGELDAILHLAVSRRHRDFPESALQQFRVNLASTAALLDQATRSGVEHFVLMSTGSVYDAVGGGLMREADAVAPTSYFAATKAAAELLLGPYADRMAVCALRLFFPYGPGQEGRLISDLLDRVATGRPVRLTGGAGGMMLCPIYVDDVVGVLEAVIAESWRGVYNLAGPEILTLRQIAEAIGEALGKSPVFESAEGPELRFVPNQRRLEEKLEVGTFCTFREGIRRTLAAS